MTNKSGYKGRILGIETSCDDTCISLIETKDNQPSFKVLSNIISSQEKLHKRWGGIYPTLARREHQKNLTPILKKTLVDSKLEKKLKKKNSQPFDHFLEKDLINYKKLDSYLRSIEKPEIDAIAVTIGPGLDPSLWTGINFAKTLASCWQIPIIPINHIEAHLIISLFSFKDNLLKFTDQEILPAVALIVSGGHTQLLLMKEIGKYKMLGETRDDAAGECFDKTARILGLGYPGGPEISKKAAQWEKKRDVNDKEFLPRPMLHSKDLDFSFSGLKTAVLYKDQSVKKRTKDYLESMAYEIEESIVDVLIKKSLIALKQNDSQTLIIGGGVTANRKLRKKLNELDDVRVIMPEPGTETDNALMISVTAFFKEPQKIEEIKAQPNLNLR